MFDFHIHSTVSFDGRSTPEEVLRAARAAGLEEICFTDHIDDDPAGPAPANRFSPESYSAGYDHLDAQGLRLRLGVEFGLQPNNRDSFREVLSWRDYDFVLGSVHYADGVDAYYPEYWKDKTLFQAERKYFEDTLMLVQRHEDFDVLAHLTYISKPRIHPTHTPVKLEEHRDVIAAILETLVDKGKGLEINTSGMGRCGAFLPDRPILELYRDLGGRIVTVGSDAHDAHRVGEYTHEAVALAKAVFGHVCTFENRQPVFHR